MRIRASAIVKKVAKPHNIFGSTNIRAITGTLFPSDRNLCLMTAGRFAL
jgi:hypothetical protein